MSIARCSAALSFAVLLSAWPGPAAAQPSDKYLERPPYYTGKRPAAPGPVGHFPVAYQRGGSHDAFFDPEPNGPVAALLADMNAYLASRGHTVSLGARLPGSPPDVSFGCELDPIGECAERDDGQALGRAGTVMKLGALRPSGGWRDAARAAMAEAGVDRALVLTLEVGQYFTRQRGLRGDKWVYLGTDHAVRLPWLTSLETPVTVLQLTGALVDRDGRVTRIGAEGFLARRTRFSLSAFEAQQLITEEDVAAARRTRRDDLPGRPLAWQEALERLIEGLAGPIRAS